MNQKLLNQLLLLPSCLPAQAAAMSCQPKRHGRTQALPIDQENLLNFVRVQREAEAAVVITTYARKRLDRKHGKATIHLFPSIAKLKVGMLDEKALKAGAADCEWYTDENMIARERLKHDRDVVDALEAAWCAISAACEGRERLDHDDYILMSRKIYLALKSEAGEGAHSRRAARLNVYTCVARG